MKSNVGKRITDEFIAELFADAYRKIATIDKCVRGFRAAGIWPLDCAVFNIRLRSSGSSTSWPANSVAHPTIEQHQSSTFRR